MKGMKIHRTTHWWNTSISLTIPWWVCLLAETNALVRLIQLLHGHL